MKREWDPGTFRVVDSVLGEIGFVFVTGEAGRATDEHYVLLHGFKSPDGIRSSMVEKALKQYATFSEFWAAMQSAVTASGKPGRYVKAVCSWSTIDP